MAKNTNNKNKNMNSKTVKNVKQKPTEKKADKNTIIMKILVFLGVVIFCFILIYLMYHFFVKESDIKINMSTDKQIEYLTIKGEEELIITQKYVSDLTYNMRYDVNSFKVFKYKDQDLFRNLNNERIVVAVEKSSAPSNCSTTTLDNEYNNCYIKVDGYTEEYYISSNNKTYKITVKTSGSEDYTEEFEARINNMLKSFEINI